MRLEPTIPLFIGIVLSAGCAASAPATSTNTASDRAAGPPPPPGSASAQDQAFTFPALTLAGSVFQPEAFLSIEPTFSSPPRRSVVEQRRRYARARGATKVAEGVTLAGMLWAPSQGSPDRQEARKILRSVVSDDSSEALVAQLAFAELSLGDVEAARPLLDRLVKRFGSSSSAGRYKAMRAWVHLRAGERKRAAKLVEGVSGPEAAYVTGWIKFRAGDIAGAHQSMIAALKEWKDEATGDRLRREVMLVAARSAIDPAAVMKLLIDSVDKDKNKAVEVLAALSEAYEHAGQYEERNLVLQQIANGASPAILATMRYHQSDVEYRLNHPDPASRRVLESWDAATRAGSTLPAQSRAEIIKRMFELAAIFHRVYGTSYDRRYGEAAHRLYKAYVGIKDAPHLADAKKRAQGLQTLLANEPPNGGLHEQEEIGRRFVARVEEILECYERVLQTSPKLAGTVTVNVDIIENGIVGGLTTDPQAGPNGLPAVAGCVSAQISLWTFPQRSRPGTTSVTYPISFSTKSVAKESASK